MVFLPISIGKVSPRATTPCHNDEPCPRVTSPTTVAFGAIQSDYSK